jgi:hypothetical protein
MALGIGCFAECPSVGTRQSIFLFLFIFLTKLFVVYSYTMYTYVYHFRIIITVFSIASRFSSFILISSKNSDLNCKSLETWKIVHAKMIPMLTKHGRKLAIHMFKNCIKHKQSQKIMKLVHVS